MKELILTRHAKSDWGGPLLRDHARPLNTRGRRSAAALGEWLRAQDLIPDQILCSSSARTQETCTRLKLPVLPELCDALYLAEVPDMLRVLRGAIGARVLMLGHNPGIADFAASLVATPPAHERFDDYPTGATLVVRFDINDWADLMPGTGTAQHFVIPRTLN
ncbi:histidine phosphatase superfamily [Roseovarius sp. A-2]|uniref:SixA phosphatase family protein n=1 Tax=Roseovarius sp. A-2 TaxID=1570360 RepID=UPI0009B52E17|nr:histidine phosphatase family protein [Roseovarius sp. A-2]GAW33930.1 histidine phosphatase superfamily [Roseovarius sp. A-2]